MKTLIDGIVVVEGKTDVAFLNEFINAEFVITNGSDVPQATINYLKEISKTRKIYVLTDPDFPGKQIRDTLDSQIDNLIHCFVDKSVSIKKGKVGVAESTKEEVLKALKNGIVNKNNAKGTVTITDLYNLDLIGKESSEELRKTVCDKLNLGFCNAKTFLKRINNNGITLETIKNCL